MAQWLEHLFCNGVTQVGEGIFSAMLYTCFDFHVVRWGLTSEIGPKFCLRRLSVIINEDFFEEGGGVLGQSLSPINLHKVDFA